MTMTRLGLWAVLLASVSGCSTGIDRLESIGVEATEVLVNLKTETGFEMTNIRNVDVKAGVDFDAFLDIAPSVAHISLLRVSGQNLSCAQIDGIVGIKGLTHLVLDSCQFDDDCLSNVGKISTLESIAINNVPVTTSDLEFLKDLPKVHTVTLIGTAIDDSIVTVLAEIPQLKQVLLSETELGDTFAASAVQIPKLNRIHLDSTKVTSAGVAALTQHPRVNRIHALHLPLDDTIKDAFNNSPSLEAIALDVSEKDALNNSGRVTILPPSRAMENLDD